ncbi:BON domain-containing protein [Mangrovihabitans endophyticus]|uniref:BON domain-containing protein n=1 Tax=Mangrovihabitans endophyticus TaxID=1751298 RepID=A0A8J3C527_9ACTN|nr:BON domain-containing protein [Mangrovihabitans endophyticus]GGL19676.1 hypothetical protein GCM10012284_62840 [Mangrovihabitans endophyticus]
MYPVWPQWEDGDDRRLQHDERDDPTMSETPPWSYLDEVDEALVEGVAERLVADTTIRGRRVQVTVQNCVVILEGNVDTAESKDAAGRQAWATPGVYDVCNMLTTDA